MPPSELQLALQRRRWAIDGLRLIRSQQVPELDDDCGRYLTYRQLIECGETWEETRIDNRPTSPDSYTALYDLATNVLDPVIEYFGMIKLTYGFCSPPLGRLIKGRIAPKLDQHAAHETNRRGVLICERLGAAVDFLVEDEDMREVANWVARQTDFDRLYFYGPDRPIHISHGPERRRHYYEFFTTPDGRNLPRRSKEN